MQGEVLPLPNPGGGMGKAFSDSANYGSRLSTIYIYVFTKANWSVWDLKA